MNRIKKMLSELGWEPERVAMYNMSAGMGEAFARVAKEFTEIIRELGPSPGNAAAADKAAS